MNREIIEGNKLIAEFMGLRFHKIGWVDAYHIDGNYECPELQYHFEWNWLMNVVEKIEEDEKFATMMYVNSWDNRGRYCFSIYRELDENKSLRHVFIEIATSSKIESIWLGVIEFIRLKNEGKIPKTEKEFSEHYLYYRDMMNKLQYGEI